MVRPMTVGNSKSPPSVAYGFRLLTNYNPVDLNILSTSTNKISTKKILSFTLKDWLDIQKLNS